MEICRQCRHRVMEEDEDVFVMLAERMTKIRGEWSLTMSRLFPGYLFVKTDRIRDFYKRLRSIGQTAKILRTGEEMTPLYPEEEAYLKMAGGDEHIVRYSEGYIQGDELVAISGAVKDCGGKIKKILRHKRLVVLEIPLMGQAVEVTVGMGIFSRDGKGDKVKLAGLEQISNTLWADSMERGPAAD